MVLQGEQMSKAVFPFLWHPICRENAYSEITCQYKLINEKKNPYYLPLLLADSLSQLPRQSCQVKKTES